MRIKDNLDFKAKNKPATFATDDTVQQALDVMCEKNIGSVIVVNPDETIAGIVTERDMMTRVLKEKINPETTKLGHIMSTDVKVANENDDLVDWMHTMSYQRFRHLPIVDEQGKLVNVLSQGDFMAYTWPDLYEKVKQDFKGGVARYFQILLILLTLVILGLVALKL